MEDFYDSNIFFEESQYMSRSTTDLFKKAVLVAVGATAVTVDKINGVVDELVDKGEMSEQQGKSFKEEIKEKARSEKESLEKRFTDITQKATTKVLREIGVVTKKDLEEMEERIIARLEGRCIEKHKQDCECEDCVEEKKHAEGCECEDCIN